MTSYGRMLHMSKGSGMPTAVIKRLHRHKAAGVDGAPPGAFKILANEWLCIVTYLFNLVFSGEYSREWAYTKMFTIFKKDNLEDVNNYRGISVQGALTKKNMRMSSIIDLPAGSGLTTSRQEGAQAEDVPNSYLYWGC